LISCSLLLLRRFVGLVVDFVVVVGFVRRFVDVLTGEFVVFAFAFGVVVVSFLRFFSRLATVLVDRERLFRVVSEDFDEVFLGERVEDTFFWVFVVPLDDKGVFAFLGDINHVIEWLAILPLYSVTWHIGHLA